MSQGTVGYLIWMYVMGGAGKGGWLMLWVGVAL